MKHCTRYRGTTRPDLDELEDASASQSSILEIFDEAGDVEIQSPTAVQSQAEACYSDSGHLSDRGDEDDTFYDCESWPSSPTASHAASSVGDLVELRLRSSESDLDLDIIVPVQTPVHGGMGTILKGYAVKDGRVRSIAVKLSRSYDPEIPIREISAWRRLQHPNVLPFYGICQVGSGSRLASQHALLSPYLKAGNLLEYLHRNPQADRLQLMIDVASGLAYLHDEVEIVHGDIKAENILITDDGAAVLADFGLSTTVQPGDKPTGNQIRQLYTLAYCAPELVDDQAHYAASPNVIRSKTTMSDVYAYGMLLYQTFAGGLSSSRGAQWKLMGDMAEGKFPPRPSLKDVPAFCDELWELCTRCWVIDPHKRPPIASIVRDLMVLHSAHE